jgi:hypothetical protein
MEIDVGGRKLKFAFDEDRGALVVPFKLPAWAGFKSENSQPDLRGERVMFVLAPESPDAELASADRYARAIGWFLDHQEPVKAAALEAIAAWIETLRDEGIEDEELEDFSSPKQLASMIDLSYVHFYPQGKSGEPYFGLELECNWDPESGCGVMFHGTSVVETGVSDSVQGGFDIEQDGGRV